MATQRWACYLVFSAHGVLRMTRSAPDLKGGEHAVRITLKVPGSTFARIFPEATVTVPESAVITPKVDVLPAEATP
jgi:hypothetical protein